VSELSNDLLRGVRAISAELGLSERIVYDQLVRHLIPGAKIGKIWTSSRSKLAKHYADRIDASVKGELDT
jgi:hypothetical protein